VIVSLINFVWSKINDSDPFDSDYSAGICPEVYIIPIDLATPTTIVYPDWYDSDVAYKLKLADFVNDVCIDGVSIEWADK